jgi:hypothetical protein
MWFQNRHELNTQSTDATGVSPVFSALHWRHASGTHPRDSSRPAIFLDDYHLFVETFDFVAVTFFSSYFRGFG